MKTMDRRQLVAVAAVGTLATRLARLESLAVSMPQPDGSDALAVGLVDLDGTVTYPAGVTIGPGTLVVTIGTRPDGPA